MTNAVGVAELKSFSNAAKGVLPEAEIDELIVFLALSPKSGVLIPGTGGMRKLRWKARGKGKRGGARVIYYYHSQNIPLVLVTVFSKGERVDLSQSDRNNMKALTKALVAEYGG